MSDALRAGGPRSDGHQDRADDGGAAQDSGGGHSGRTGGCRRMKPVPLVALVGNPNAGKTSLFNALTGARQKVGNYPGVTVERKTGRWLFDDGRQIDLIDLPGTYSLDARSPDEPVTHDVVMGSQARSEERRAGKGGVSTCRSGWSRDN